MVFSASRNRDLLFFSSAAVITPASFVPSQFTQLTTEIFPMVFDFTPVLLGGETIQSVTSSLTDVTVSPTVPVSLPDSPTVNTPATSATQIVRGSTFPTTTHVYRLIINVVISTGALPKTWSGVLEISVPF